MFCGKLVQHIQTHMNIHQEKPEVKEILRNTNPDFTTLRKLGDHEHNRISRGNGGNNSVKETPGTKCHTVWTLSSV